MTILVLFVASLLLILVATVKINQSKVAVYHFKYYFYYAAVSTAAFLWLPYFATRPKDVVNLLTASTLLKPVSSLLNIKWELRGAEHISEKKSVIMVANHQTSLDILGMFAIWHTMGRVAVIAKKELLYVWPFGLAAWLCGLVFIDKKNVVASRKIMKSAMERLKVEKIKLWVFPEGTRRNTGKLHEFKKGAFHLAIQSKTPIVPVVYSSYLPFMNDAEKYFNPGKVIIEALPEISTEDYTPNDIDKLITKTRNAMEEVFAKNSKETRSQILN